VRDHHEGRAAVARQLQHQLEHAVGRAAVEVAGGLVGQHAGRMRDQRAGNRHPLALAARQFRRPVVDALLQAHLRQHVGGRARDLAADRAGCAAACRRCRAR
jgi:hypothetical protein